LDHNKINNKKKHWVKPSVSCSSSARSLLSVSSSARLSSAALFEEARRSSTCSIFFDFNLFQILNYKDDIYNFYYLLASYSRLSRSPAHSPPTFLS
jgi:hypothetical protein